MHSVFHTPSLYNRGRASTLLFHMRITSKDGRSTQPHEPQVRAHRVVERGLAHRAHPIPDMSTF